jgi:hypothetical protein
MIKPCELESDRERDLWDTIAAGDTSTLWRLLERDPSLSRAEYWYTQPIHFAVRDGHLEAVRSFWNQAETRNGMDITISPPQFRLAANASATRADPRTHLEIAGDRAVVEVAPPKQSP